MPANLEENFNWKDDLMSRSYQKQESHLAKLSKDRGKDYGKPIEGTESDIRSKAYQKEVMNEVINICYQISELGQRTKDGTEYITFGELFRLSQNISNKCVGILQRGRKHRLLHFNGETLWQGADDKKIITLIRKNREIQVYYDYTKHLLPNNPEGNYWMEINGPRKTYYEWVTNVKELSPTTTAYCVQVNIPENDDSHDLPARCFPLTHESEVPTRPNYLVEPQVIFKLRRPVVTAPPTVLNLLKEYFDPCLWFDTEDIAALPALVTADVSKEEAWQAGKYTVTIPVTRKMKETTSPLKMVAPVVKIKRSPEKAITPVVMRPAKIKYELDYRKSSITFSTCTTMYKPPDPVYEQIKCLQSRPKSILSTSSSLSVSSTSSLRQISSLSRSRSMSSTPTSKFSSSLSTTKQRYRRMSTEIPESPQIICGPNSRFNFG